MDPRVLYGVTIHDAIKTGNKSDMQSLLSEAQKQHAELGAAISELQRAVGGGAGTIMPMYGAPIYDAIRRNDPTEMRTLLDQARQAHSQQGGDLGKAISDLEKALGK